MTIGDFSRATRLSAKTLRFYHQVGLLPPAHVEPSNGYRLYEAEQIARAQQIRTYRSLDMPVDVVKEVLATDDSTVRDELIAAHLAVMEAQLESTRSAISALRSLLEPAKDAPRIEHRTVAPVAAAVIGEVIDLDDLGDWYTEAMAELDRLVESGVEPGGPRGGIWENELFLNERGEARVFVPVRSLDVPVSGRVRTELLPAAELAVATHVGPDDTIGEAYAALGRYVAERGIGAAGPVRESYLMHPTAEALTLVTEIGWPVVGGF